MHGMRWRTWRDDPRSPLRDQQSIGISEAFSFHVDEPHGPGDYLWSFASNDDTWLGCWGLFRLHDELPGAFGREALPPFDPRGARRYQVRARAAHIEYSDQRSDPRGVVYETDGSPPGEPLVLRARAGEWVEVTLFNELPGPGEASEFDPPLPAKDHPGDREISGRVSQPPVAPAVVAADTSARTVGGRRGHHRGPKSRLLRRWSAATLGRMRRALSHDLELDDDPARIDVAAVQDFLSNDSYWARGRSVSETHRLVRDASRVIGLYDGPRQIGFARVVSDDMTIAYLADVYVLAPWRGRGLGMELVREAVEHGPHRGIRWILHTADGHDLYRKFGFTPPSDRLLVREAERGT